MSAEDPKLIRAREMAKMEHQKVLDKMKHPNNEQPVAMINSFTNLSNLAILNRIYVGSIQFEVSEVELGTIFGAFGTIKSINMMMDPQAKRHKGYGFIEYETPEAAALAQANMEGTELAGRPIKVGRPTNFPSNLPVGVPYPLPNRIYVANVHELIQEGELMAIFEAFGKVNHCNLVPDLATRKHKGYGYVEFEQANHALAAIQSLNGFELAGRTLKVGKTVVGGPIPAGMSKLNEANPSMGKPKLPNAVLRAAQQINQIITGSSSTIPASSAILLGNLEDLAQAKNDTELLSDLEADISEECQKFGTVHRCKIILNSRINDVQCFVAFDNPLEAQQAIKVMDKRWFGGRQISALSVPEDYDYE
jgi:poly(U)-binding-splicing factor PUF60